MFISIFRALHSFPLTWVSTCVISLSSLNFLQYFLECSSADIRVSWFLFTWNLFCLHLFEGYFYSIWKAWLRMSYFQHFKDACSHHLTSTGTNQLSLTSLFSMWCIIFYGCFWDFSLCLAFSSLTMRYIGVVSLKYFLFGAHRMLWICKLLFLLLFLNEFGTFLPLSFQIIFLSLSLLSFWDTFYLYIRLNIFPRRSLGLCSFLSYFFFSLFQIRYLLGICL